MTKKIINSTKLTEILKIRGAEEILGNYNFPCLACPKAKFEMEKLRIGEVCKIYGIDLDSLLKDLNEKSKKQGFTPLESQHN